MAQRRERWSSASQTAAAQVKRFREQRGWSADDLAAECARLGATELTRSVIANLESRRRGFVTVDELLLLAYALDVAPVHLIVPTERRDDLDADRYRVVPDIFLPPEATREWIRGTFCPPGRDPRRYFGNVPAEEYRPPTPAMVEYGKSLDEVLQAERDVLSGNWHLIDPPGDRPDAGNDGGDPHT